MFYLLCFPLVSMLLNSLIFLFPIFFSCHILLHVAQREVKPVSYMLLFFKLQSHLSLNKTVVFLNNYLLKEKQASDLCPSSQLKVVLLDHEAITVDFLVGILAIFSNLSREMFCNCQ